MDTDQMEGYADGLSGAGLQSRTGTIGCEQYERGFMTGSADRKAMINAQEAKLDAFIAWCEGLTDDKP